MAARGALDAFRKPCDRPARPHRQITLGHDVFGHVFVNVVDDLLAASAEKKANRNKFGVVEVVYIGTLAASLSVNSPNGTRHPSESGVISADGSDVNLIRDRVFGMRADDRDMKACAGQRPALLVKNARVERGVNRRHVHDLGGFPHFCVGPERPTAPSMSFSAKNSGSGCSQ